MIFEIIIPNHVKIIFVWHCKWKCGGVKGVAPSNVESSAVLCLQDLTWCQPQWDPCAHIPMVQLVLSIFIQCTLYIVCHDFNSFPPPSPFRQPFFLLFFIKSLKVWRLLMLQQFQLLEGKRSITVGNQKTPMIPVFRPDPVVLCCLSILLSPTYSVLYP